MKSQVLSILASFVALFSGVASAAVPLPPANLCVDAMCMESGAIDWHPGHYIAAAANTDATDVANVVKFVNARPYLRGVILRPYWRSLETARGSYDFSLIDKAISDLNPDKHVFVQIQTAIFGTSSAGPETLLPGYLTTAEFDGGAYDDGSDVKTKVWNAAVMDRKIALIEALAAKYNDVDKFEGVITGESAMSLDTGEGTSGYSPSALAAQLQRLMPKARSAFSNKNLVFYLNFISGSGGSNYFQPILEAARKSDYIVGGPDSLYLNPTTGREYINGTQGSTDYRGRIGIQVGDQASGLSNTDYSAATLIKWGISQGANYFFWQYMPTSANFGPIMDYISSNPTAFVSAYPKEFP